MPRQRTHHSRIVYVFPDDFPQRLARFKEESGLSWAELARRLGTSALNLKRWKDGVRPILRHLMALLEKSIHDFDAALGLEQNYGLAHYARGITNLNLGEFHSALRDFDAVIGRDPDSAAALRGRGVALGNLGRNDEAMRDLDRSLALDPGNGETLTARGLAHTSLEPPEQAIADYTRVIDLDPGDTAVLYSRGLAHMRLDRYERESRTSAPSSA